MGMPKEGDLLDIKVDEIASIKKNVVARLRVLKRDETRDIYLMQVVDVRQEAQGGDHYYDVSKES